MDSSVSYIRNDPFQDRVKIWGVLYCYTSKINVMFAHKLKNKSEIPDLYEQMK